MNKQDWLPVEVNSFKESGKWGYEHTVLIPNDIGSYERRQFLESYIKENLSRDKWYVSVDSNVLGYPYMFFNK